MPHVTKFTLGTLAPLVSALHVANTRAAAAAAGGINFDTFAEWMKDEDRKLPEDLTLPEVLEGEGPVTYPAGMPFRDLVEAAEALSERAIISRIRYAAQDASKVTLHYDRQGVLMREVREFDWRAAAWLAEHNPQHRKKWIAPKVAEISGPDGGPIKTDGRASVTFEPDAAYLAALGKAAADDGEEPEDLKS